jgi:hypothetical protein
MLPAVAGLLITPEPTVAERPKDAVPAGHQRPPHGGDIDFRQLSL